MAVGHSSKQGDQLEPDQPGTWASHDGSNHHGSLLPGIGIDPDEHGSRDRAWQAMASSRVKAVVADDSGCRSHGAANIIECAQRQKPVSVMLAAAMPSLTATPVGVARHRTRGCGGSAGSSLVKILLALDRPSSARNARNPRRLPSFMNGLCHPGRTYARNWGRWARKIR
jgi:hypothetical protein